MPNKKLRSPLQQGAGERRNKTGREKAICTPLPADITGPGKGEVKGEGKGRSL